MCQLPKLRAGFDFLEGIIVPLAITFFGILELKLISKSTRSRADLLSETAEEAWYMNRIDGQQHINLSLPVYREGHIQPE